jgi:DNA-binding transcriptional LysR family regulator
MVARLNYKTQTYRSNLAGRLRVSVASSGKYVMPYFLSGFLTDNPAVDLAMDVTNKMQVLRSLENNTVDFALVSVVPDHLKVNTMTLLFPGRWFCDHKWYGEVYPGEVTQQYQED